MFKGERIGWEGKGGVAGVGDRKGDAVTDGDMGGLGG
jgi:hypothetical protein